MQRNKDDSDNDSEILRQQINFNEGEENSEMADVDKWKKGTLLVH